MQSAWDQACDQFNEEIDDIFSELEYMDKPIKTKKRTPLQRSPLNELIHRFHYTLRPPSTAPTIDKILWASFD